MKQSGTQPGPRGKVLVYCCSNSYTDVSVQLNKKIAHLIHHNPKPDNCGHGTKKGRVGQDW